MILSNHFKHSLTALITAIILLIAGWFGLRSVIGNPTMNPVLRPQDKEHIVYNSVSHILTVTTAKGTVKSYTRNPDILIEKNGAVIIKKHLMGFEYSPFLAVGVSFDGLYLRKNGYLGINLVELWRFDLGPALAIGESGVRPLVQVQYNVVSNTGVMVGWWPGVYHAAIVVKF